jgi:hypothetical protein
VSEVTPALERCETEDIDESCDGAAACDGEAVLAKSYGDGATQELIRATVDSTGAMIFAVVAQGSVDYGGGPLDGTGNRDLHLVKLGADGRHLWSTMLSGGTDHYLGGLAVDAEDNILISGSYAGAILFDGVPHPGEADNLWDLFVAKFDPNGLPTWIQTYTGPGEQRSTRLAVDGSGNVLVVGHYGGTFMMDDTMHMLRGLIDGFIAKFDAGGALQWSCSIGGTSEDIIDDVALGPGGEVVITGSFINNIDLGPGGDLDSRSGFIAAFQDTCVHAWSQLLVSTEETRGQGLAIDAENRVLATGYFDETVDFGGASPSANGAPDVYLAAYQLDGGGLLWVRQFGNDSAQSGVDVTLDRAGNVILIGNVEGQIDLGAKVPLVANANDAFVAKLAPSTDDGPGEFLWNQLFTGPDLQHPLTVDTDALGNIVVAGAMYDLLSVSGTVLEYAGAGDVWIAKLRP